LIEKLRVQNIEFEELIMPDEIHDLLRWSNLRSKNSAVAASGKPK
jgi:hypothetical protein